jgi:uncharacterized protein YegP (UPF0339 family)
MRKLLRSFVLFAAISGLLTAAGLSVAPAQVKDKKDDKPKDDKTKVEEIGVTEVYMAKDGWRFRIKNADGKSVAIGTIAHEKKEDALKAVEFVKTAMTKGKVVEIKDDKK